MEKLPRLVPLIPLELPGLPSSNDTDDAIPSICTKFRQRIDTVHDEIGVFDDCLLPAGVDSRSFPVYGDHVLRFHVALCGGTALRILRRFKTRDDEPLGIFLKANALTWNLRGIV